MSVTITFTPALSITVPASDNLDSASQTLTISTISVTGITINPTNGSAEAFGVDNNGAAHQKNFQLDTTTIAGMRTDLQTAMVALEPSNNPVVS